MRAGLAVREPVFRGEEEGQRPLAHAPREDAHRGVVATEHHDDGRALELIVHETWAGQAPHGPGPGAASSLDPHDPLLVADRPLLANGHPHEALAAAAAPVRHA